MQKLFFSILFIFVISICNAGNNKNESKISFIKAFYTQYITQCADNHNSINEMTETKQRYCTKALIESINKLELDYDPFVKAQDCNIECLKTLKIETLSAKKNEFTVSYTDSYSKENIKIILCLMETKKGLRINKLLID